MIASGSAGECHMIASEPDDSCVKRVTQTRHQDTCSRAVRPISDPRPGAPGKSPGSKPLTPIIHDRMERRIADQLKSALIEFLLAAKTGSATHVQRAALGRAFALLLCCTLAERGAAYCHDALPVAAA